MISLKSSDNQIFRVDEAVALQSQIITFLIEDNFASSEIPLANVTSTILTKVIEYCSGRAQFSAPDDEGLKAFDKAFVRDLDMDTLVYIMLAANYLCMDKLLQLACRTAADRIKEYSPEQCREFFNIDNDYTEEEENEIRQEHAWAFE